jgi:mannose-6-phosphate isomerase-like protein (cupin superfamily)
MPPLIIQLSPTKWKITLDLCMHLPRHHLQVLQSQILCPYRSIDWTHCFSERREVGRKVVDLYWVFVEGEGILVMLLPLLFFCPNVHVIVKRVYGAPRYLFFYWTYSCISCQHLIFKPNSTHLHKRVHVFFYNKSGLWSMLIVFAGMKHVFSVKKT